MKHFDLGPLHVTTCFVRDAGWIIINRLIVHAKRSRPLFSERYEYERFARIPFCSWRFRIGLKRKEVVTPNGPTNGPRHAETLNSAFGRDESFDPADFMDEEPH